MGFDAGYGIGSVKPGVCTSSTRPGSPFDGQVIYETDTNVVSVYDGAAWATVGPSAAGGLVFITAQTIGSAVSSVPVPDVFSSTYDNYKIMLSGGTGSVNDDDIAMILGATTAGYFAAYTGASYAAVSTINGNNNVSSWTRVGSVFTDGLYLDIDLLGPNLAKRTRINGVAVYENNARPFGGVLKNTTVYTAFTITPASGTLTGGTIRVYGYQNS